MVRTLLYSMVTGFCWGLFGASAGADDDASLPVIVMAGQSNMVGKRCLKDELPEVLQKPNQRVSFFDSSTRRWIPLEPGKTEPLGFGPEISCGAKMSELLNQPIGIIKHSRGGTNLAKQWNPDDPKSLYAELVQQVKLAQSSRRLKIVGMVWQQGGADAKLEEMANAYAENLQRLIQQARKDFSNPEMVFVSGRIPPKDDRKKPFWKTVRSAQQNLAIGRYAWIDCDDLSVGPDGIHYNTAGMVALGNLQAANLYELLRRSSQ